ncbi:MAG TPA: hypothetical protein VIC85_11485 [Ktedonobacterales bacterium]|jgi:hypothetical protein
MERLVFGDVQLDWRQIPHPPPLTRLGGDLCQRGVAGSADGRAMRNDGVGIGH